MQSGNCAGDEGFGVVSSSGDENEWDPTGKSIEEILAFLKKWERYARIQTVLAL